MEFFCIKENNRKLTNLKPFYKSLGLDIDDSIYKGLINIQSLKFDLDTKGYAIIKNQIKKSHLNEIKNFCFSTLKEAKEGSLSIKKENFIQSFYGEYVRKYMYVERPESLSFWNLMRYLHVLKLCLDTNGRHTDLSKTSIYQYKKYNHFVDTITLYKKNGSMAPHSDIPKSTKYETLKYHAVLILTEKNRDYSVGGLEIINIKKRYKDFTNPKKLEWVDVESEASFGDIIFFDSQLLHQVRSIQTKKNQLGRLMIFTIGYNQLPKKPKNILSKFKFQVYGRYKYLKYKLGLGFNETGKNFR